MIISYIDQQFQRQSLIKGWSQARQRNIERARVAIVGSDYLSQMVLIGLAGMGFLNLAVIDNGRISRQNRDPLCIGSKNPGREKVYEVCKTLELINAQITTTPIYAKYAEAFLYRFNPDVVVHADNDSVIKQSCFAYAQKHSKVYIGASASGTRCDIVSWRPKTLIDLEKLIQKQFDAHKQGISSTCIAAGIVVDEIRRTRFKLKRGEIDLSSSNPITYNLNSISRTSTRDNLADVSSVKYANSRVLVVGAGAIGTYLALNLAVLGFGEIDIMDYDDIDITNLNRQFLFYKRIGEKKAKVMAERLRRINPSIRIGYYHKKFNRSTKAYLRKRKYDLIFSCVDNHITRKEINDLAIKLRIPVVNGATNAYSGNANIYLPGLTKCLDCQLDLYSGARRERQQQTNNSCLVQEPSVVVPNMVIGGLMAGEAQRILSSKRKYDLRGILNYSSGDTSPLFKSKYIPFRRRCSCGV